MPIYENKSRLNMISIPKEKMDEIVNKNEATSIYCTGNGFGRTEGFENYFTGKMTYKEFIDKLIEKGLLVKVR